MRYGIFSDVHSNLEAFEAALDFYKKEVIDKFIYLGDIVGYGANPNECSALLRRLNPICIAGNHDWAAIGEFSVSYFNEAAKEVILWTQEYLSEENIQYLRTFALTHEEDDFICVHGSLDEPQRFNYIFDISDAQLSFSYLEKRICFIGHSHRREAFRKKNNSVSVIGDLQIKLEKNSQYIINVGSVGQPRDRDPRLSLCVYDDDQDVVKFARLEYNIKKAADKIIEKGLPLFLAERLYVGR
jgi:diadenosine tetraphosphatase ApaH/serine/threonine PP2A family protein phosphatase